MLQLTPSTDQVLFQGDVFSLTCRVPSSVYHVIWYHDEQRFLADRSSGELHQNYRDPDRDDGVISTVRLERLRPRHSGNWTCDARTSLTHVSRSVCRSLTYRRAEKWSVFYCESVEFDGYFTR